MARLPGSGSVRPKLIDGIDGIGNDDVLGIIGASGGDSLCAYPPGPGAVSGVIGIGNWGIGIEIFGFIDAILASSEAPLQNFQHHTIVFYQAPLEGVGPQVSCQGLG